MLLSSMAHSQNAGFGSLSNDRNEPLHFNSDSLIFNQAKNIAELFDGVKITQGKSTLNAEYVKVIYSKTDNNLEKILAEKNDIEWISGNFKCQELPYDATNSRHPVISEVECLFI